MPQTTQSPGLPSTTRHSVDGSRFGSQHKSFRGSFRFPTRVRKPFLKIQNVASPMASQGYPCANQRTPFLSLCLCCPLLFARSKPFSRAPQALFHKLSISFSLWVWPGVHRNYCSTWPQLVLAPQKRGLSSWD